MSRPRTSFTDRLDEFLEQAREQEVRDVLASIRIWARWRKFGFAVVVKEFAVVVKEIESTSPEVSQ